MDMTRHALTQGAWTLLSDKQSVLVDVETAATILVHLNESATAPDLDAPAFQVQSWPAAFDFFLTGLTSGTRIWARGRDGNVSVVVATK